MGWEEFRKGFFVGFLAIADLCALRVSAFQRRPWGPVNAEAQRNAEGARSGRKIGEDEDGKGGVQEGIFCWIPRDCRSLRSPRFCVSRKGSCGPLNAEAQSNAEGERSGSAKKSTGRKILAAGIGLLPEIDVAGTFFVPSTGLVGQPSHARVVGRRNLQGSAVPGGNLGTSGFERQA